MSDDEITLDLSDIKDVADLNPREDEPREDHGDPEAEQPTAVDPATGAVIFLDDIDSLVRACDDTTKLFGELRDFDRTLRQAAISFVKDERKKTRRIRGREWEATLSDCDSVHEEDRTDCMRRANYPDGSLLKEAWFAYPQFRDQYLKIETVKIKARECAKLAAMKTDDPAFDVFRKIILKAIETGSPKLPKVVAKRISEDEKIKT